MNIIQCPNCKSSLRTNPKSLQCDNGHNFDIAKEGYTNLILAHQKKKLNAGDNKSMISAREAFLSAGFYDSLLDNIQSIVLSTISNDINSNKKHLLDLGCGSGYYTRSLFRQQEGFNKIGIDISKPGISTAAKKDKHSTYLVASIFNLPLVDKSIDIITNIFAPCDLKEVQRVLKHKGILVKVIPDNNHMQEVAQLVYDSFKPHTSNIEEAINAESDFSVIETYKIEQRVSLKDEDLYNLISMTPYFYKFKEEQLSQLNEMLITFSFKIIIGQLN